MDRHEAGHLVEIAHAAFQVARHVAEGRGKPFDGLSDGGQPLHLHQAFGLLLDPLLQVFGVLPELPAHGDAFPGPLQGDLQHVVVDGLGDEVGRLELEALDGEIDIAVAGDHDDFGLRPLRFDGAQKPDPVQPRHLDVGENDVRHDAAERLQGLQAVFGRQHVEAAVRQGNAQHPADTLLVVRQQQGVVHDRVRPTAEASGWCAAASPGREVFPGRRPAAAGLRRRGH